MNEPQYRDSDRFRGTLFPESRPFDDELWVDRFVRRHPVLGPWVLVGVLLLLWGIAGWIAP